MWAMPDLMAAMLEQKIAHPGRREHCLGALADRRHAARTLPPVDVKAVQEEDTPRARLDDMLSIPVATRPNWTPEEIQQNSTTTPGHPRLCRALDRPGRRLLEGAGHQRSA
jgi:malate synthase